MKQANVALTIIAALLAFAAPAKATTMEVITFGRDDYAGANPFDLPMTAVDGRYTEAPVMFTISGVTFGIQLTATNNAGGNAEPQANNVGVGVNSMGTGASGDSNTKIDEIGGGEEFLSFEIVNVSGGTAVFSGYRLNNYSRFSSSTTFDDGEWRFSSSGAFSNIPGLGGSANNPNANILDLPTQTDFIQFTTGSDAVGDGFQIRGLQVTVPSGGSTAIMFGLALLGLSSVKRRS